MGEVGVLLEHHSKLPSPRWEVGNILTTDENAATVRLLKPRNHPQDRGFSGSAGSQHCKELSIPDLKVDSGSCDPLAKSFPNSANVEKGEDAIASCLGDQPGSSERARVVLTASSIMSKHIDAKSARW